MAKKTLLKITIFELIYKLCAFFILVQPCLTLINSKSVLSICILLLLVLLITTLDIVTIILLLNNQNKKMFEVIKLSINKTLDLLTTKNILLVVPTILLLISFAIEMLFLSKEFLNIDMVVSKNIQIIMVILPIVISALVYRFIYSIYYHILDNDNIKDSIAKSINSTKFNDLILVLLSQIAYLTLTYALILGASLLTINHYSIKSTLLISFNTYYTIVFLIIVFAMFILPFTYIFISNAYISKNKILENKKKIKIVDVEKLIIIILILFSIFNALSFIKNIDLYEFNTIQITAHRGYSFIAPENTMSAFEKAKEYNADWIELDVKMISDGTLIVMHDDNFYRTTGLDKDIWDAIYDDVKLLDAGSSFDAAHANERIPLFEDVIKYAKENNLNLNIELKPNGKEYEEGFEEKVFSIINKYDYKNYIISSFSYDVLEKVKKIDNNIYTVYLLLMLEDNPSEFKYANALGIEHSTLNEDIVNTIHSSNKEVFAWEVSSREDIDYMINIGVDNIITNNLEYVRELIYKDKLSKNIKKCLK